MSEPLYFPMQNKPDPGDTSDQLMHKIAGSLYTALLSGIPSISVNVNSARSTIVTSNGTVLNANASRVKFIIQNLSTNALYVKLGTGASSSDFSFILGVNSATDSGNGGLVSDDSYHGPISIYSASATRAAVVEL